jgi:ribosome modulation factor
MRSVFVGIAGQVCKEAGLPMKVCPFQKGSADYKSWVQGWKSAKKLTVKERKALNDYNH